MDRGRERSNPARVGSARPRGRPNPGVTHRLGGVGVRTECVALTLECVPIVLDDVTVRTGRVAHGIERVPDFGVWVLRSIRASRRVHGTVA